MVVLFPFCLYGQTLVPVPTAQKYSYAFGAKVARYFKEKKIHIVEEYFKKGFWDHEFTPGGSETSTLLNTSQITSIFSQVKKLKKKYNQNKNKFKSTAQK